MGGALRRARLRRPSRAGSQPTRFSVQCCLRCSSCGIQQNIRVWMIYTFHHHHHHHHHHYHKSSSGKTAEQALSQRASHHLHHHHHGSWATHVIGGPIPDSSRRRSSALPLLLSLHAWSLSFSSVASPSPAFLCHPHRPHHRRRRLHLRISLS